MSKSRRTKKPSAEQLDSEMELCYSLYFTISINYRAQLIFSLVDDVSFVCSYSKVVLLGIISIKMCENG